MLDSYHQTGDQELINLIKTSQSASSAGIPLKLSFGSDFPYQEASDNLKILENSSGVLPSFALGGLSNVWGAAMLPYRDLDIPDWPIAVSDLAPHYLAVSAMTCQSSSSAGTMDKVFPAYCDHPEDLRLNSQAASLWSDLKKSASKLTRNGILFGRGRVAVKTRSSVPGDAVCDYKGLCMYGCPSGAIYNSRETIRDFERKGLLTYRSNVVVKKITETETGMDIFGQERITKEPLKFSCSKVFLGVGVVPTSRILMESMDLRGDKLVMKDSQYFLFPMLRWRGAPLATSEPANTLSQIFLELVEGSGLQRSSHLQVYGYNELVSEALRASLGWLGKVFPVLIRFLEERIMIVQGYLHSDLSGAIETWLEENGTAAEAHMNLRAVTNPSTRGHTRKVLMKLIKQVFFLKAIPLLPMLQIQVPGRGFHSGGTIPMRKVPGRLESDIWGRPQGFKNLYVIDSSVFPSIPATTITFTVMANAHRIASGCDL
jgi:choline dehydrogenase-like flavoprotein